MRETINDRHGIGVDVSSAPGDVDLRIFYEALERWHHVWRLTHDADYWELYAGEFEEKRRRLHAELAPDHHGLTVEERRAATRRMAQWGRQK